MTTDLIAKLQELRRQYEQPGTQLRVTWCEESIEAMDSAVLALQEAETLRTALRFDAWHEDYGDVLWWCFPIVEPPYVGSPLSSDWPFSEGDEVARLGWTRIVCPSLPLASPETRETP